MPGAHSISLTFARRATVAAAITLALLIGPSSARAASPSPFAQMSRAITTAHSLKMVMTQTTSGGAMNGSSLTMQEVAVRQGTTFAFDALMTVRTAAGTSTTLEMVHTSAHTCIRQAPRAAWNCLGTSAATSGALNMTPESLARTFGLAGARAVPIGTAVIQRQRCAGYRFSYAVMGLQAHGTLWLSMATRRPVQQTSVISLTTSGASTPLVSTLTVIWSHWNDTKLTIPSVP
jgi:hypothetical protein